MSHNGESSASKISSGALYPPVSPTIPPASGPVLRDPILYPNPNSHSSSEEPLFRDGDTHRVVDNHMAAQGSRGLGRISPPRQNQYELALEFKSQFGNPSGTKRRLSESDIHHASMTIADEVPIVPNYEGVKAHIRRLNPGMDSQYNWLVSRIAH
jgi:hypothetical protein